MTDETSGIGQAVAVLEDGRASPSTLIDFFQLVGKLKTTRRTGWVRNGVHLPESVADHMYRSSIISLVLAKHEDRDHAVKLALAHDLAEASVGDITPYCGVTGEEKHARERSAMIEIRDKLLPGNPIGKELYDLWTEYEEARTPAALLMKDIDKFEMILNANEYEEAQDVDLSEFFKSTENKFRTPAVLPLVEELLARRRKRLAESPSTNGVSNERI